MSWISVALTSSLGRKLSMSLTGLFLVSFLIVHLSGNFLLFKGDAGAAFNLYSNFMSTNGLIRVLEIGLLLGFGIHIYTAAILTRMNAAARPVPYAMQKTNNKVTWFSRNMGLSGSIVLFFLIVHLINFWFPYHYNDMQMAVIDNKEYKDMYWLVTTVFQNEWWYSVLYLLALVLLGFHLQHGFASAFQTLGLEHKKYTPAVQFIGNLISVLIPLGFSTMPLYFWLSPLLTH
jgi:succinate dehydrogenase / fumarate reductase cytochrome b subunit